jgi:6-phosphogluconolactonase
MVFKSFDTASAWIDASVRYLEEICAKETYLTLALSGGSTPIPIYEAFAASKHLPPKLRINFFEVDERYVPSDHENSNQHLIYEHFIEPFQKRNDPIDLVASGQFFRTDITIEKSLHDYEKGLKFEMNSFDNQRTLFDITILGLGPDGHTASLFPHSPALHDTEHMVVHTTTDSFPVHDRLTLTFPTIMASQRLLLLVRGREKQAIIDDLLHSNKTIDELPAKKLIEHPDLTIMYCTE